MSLPTRQVDYLYELSPSSVLHEHPVLHVGSDGNVTYYVVITRLSQLLYVIAETDILAAWTFPAAVCHASVTHSCVSVAKSAIVCTTSDGSVWYMPFGVLANLDTRDCSRKRPMSPDNSSQLASKKRFKAGVTVSNDEVFSSLLGSSSSDLTTENVSSDGGNQCPSLCHAVPGPGFKKDVSGDFRLLVVSGAQAAVETDWGMFVLSTNNSTGNLISYSYSCPLSVEEKEKRLSVPQKQSSSSFSVDDGNEISCVCTFSTSSSSAGKQTVRLTLPLVSQLLDISSALVPQRILFWSLTDGRVFAHGSRSQFEACRSSLVCHLREAVEAIHPVCLSEQTGNETCDLLLVTGRQGRVMVISSRATGTSGPPVLFNEYRVEGPVCCSCVVHCDVSATERIPCLMWSTGTAVNWTRLDGCGAPHKNQAPLLTTSPLSFATGVCSLWPSSTDGCNGRLCSGEMVRFHLTQLITVKNDLFSTSGSLLRNCLQESLTALRSTAKEMSSLLEEESRQNSVLSQLNFVIHVFSSLGALPSLGKSISGEEGGLLGKAFMAEFRAERKKEPSGVPSAGVTCCVKNGTSQCLFPGWSVHFSIAYKSMIAACRPSWSVVQSLAGLPGGESRCVWLPVIPPNPPNNELIVSCAVHFDTAVLFKDIPVQPAAQAGCVVAPLACTRLDVLSFACATSRGDQADHHSEVKAWPLQMMQDTARLSLSEHPLECPIASSNKDTAGGESLSLLVCITELIGKEPPLLQSNLHGISKEAFACLKHILRDCLTQISEDIVEIKDDSIVEISLRTVSGHEVQVSASVVAIRASADLIPADSEQESAEQQVQKEHLVRLTLHAQTRQLLCAVHAAVLHRVRCASARNPMRLLASETPHGLRQRLLLMQPGLRLLHDKLASFQAHAQRGSTSKKILHKSEVDLRESLWFIYKNMVDFPWLVA